MEICMHAYLYVHTSVCTYSCVYVSTFLLIWSYVTLGFRMTMHIHIFVCCTAMRTICKHTKGKCCFWTDLYRGPFFIISQWIQGSKWCIFSSYHSKVCSLLRFLSGIRWMYSKVRRRYRMCSRRAKKTNNLPVLWLKHSRVPKIPPSTHSRYTFMWLCWLVLRYKWGCSLIYVYPRKRIC